MTTRLLSNWLSARINVGYYLCLSLTIFACNPSSIHDSDSVKRKSPESEQTEQLSASESGDLDANSSKRKLLNRKGWVRIDLTKSETKRARSALENHSGVYVTIVTPKNEFVTLECDTPQENPDLQGICEGYPFGEKWDVVEAAIFDIRGHVFSNTVTLRRRHDKESAVSQGELVILTIFDDDGDGKLETLYAHDATTTFHIPEWALNLK